MGVQDSMPRGDDDLVRRVGALERLYSEVISLAGGARAIAQSIQTGLGNLASSGTTWAGPVSSPSTVTASGDITAGGTVTAPTGMNSIGVYNNLLSTSYRAVWCSSTGGTGAFGYVPSSRRFKQNIATAELEIRKILPKLRVVTFRYMAAVENSGDGAPTEWGVIAEEIDALGLTWLVDYDEDGLPFGVKHERFAFLLILDAQDKQTQIDAITARLDAAGI